MKPHISKVGSSKPETYCHVHFDSLAELHETMVDPEKHPKKIATSMGCVSGYDESTSRSAEKGWDDGVGWDGAVEMAFTGWRAGGEKVAKAIELIGDNLPKAAGVGMSNDIDFAMMDEGEEVCVDSFLEGDDMHWRAPVFQREKPVVRVIVNIGVSAAISAQTIMARGTVIASMVCKLERIGYGVQLYIGDAGTNGGKTFIGTVMIKDSTEYMHASGIAFWLAHPASLRRIMFRMIELADSETGNMGCGYGMPVPFESPDFDFVSDDGHVDRAQSEGWYNNPEAAAKAAIEMIERIIERQGEVAA